MNQDAIVANKRIAAETAKKMAKPETILCPFPENEIIFHTATAIKMFTKDIASKYMSVPDAGCNAFRISIGFDMP